MVSFWEYGSIIIFYAIILLLVYFFRKKLRIEHKFIVMWKTKLGLRWMDDLSTRFRSFIVLLGYISIGLGFIGMAFIIVYMFVILIKMLITPVVTAQVGVALPGLLKVPGLGTLPFWHWLISIFIIAACHEFAHGVVARAHKVKIKSSGFLMWGPILGAFVEPDEKQLSKMSDSKQYSIFAAGPVVNIVMAVVAYLILIFAIPSLNATAVEPAGVVIIPILNQSYPLELAGINESIVINEINGVPILNVDNFSTIIRTIGPNETVTIRSNETYYTVTTVRNPNFPGDRRGFFGLYGGNILRPRTFFQKKTDVSHAWFNFVKFIQDLVIWFFILCSGIGLANLLPLGPVDGGRMVLTYLRSKYSEDKARHIWGVVSITTLVLIILIFIVQFVK